MGSFPWRSKTFWSGIGLILIGVGSILRRWQISWGDIQLILTGFGFIGLRDAIERWVSEE
ncbi:MAG: hypothetical protein DRJ26_04560 [Candidatus Methanomethylicota archaeon]|uniref:Uncharacterized protein n=1 Tax=Thermoproteota archaeon TaxID=2056631 RepID=A0A497EZG5_9CREN|nr:MAG: hypothetical protein DRJ26_04560 [Candidatus Verstraetearchaeota archaeon]